MTPEERDELAQLRRDKEELDRRVSRIEATLRDMHRAMHRTTEANRPTDPEKGQSL